jgi:hypothetical protein
MSHACADFLTTCRLTRRNLLRAGIAGFAGLNLPTLLQAASRSRGPARAKHVIFLHQFGGPSHIDTFDMKPEAPSGIRGSFRPVASAVPGVRACELLPRMARVMGLLAQIRSVHHRFSNHNPAGYLSLSGHEPPNDKGIFRDSRELFPGYGAWVSRFRPADDPGVPSWVSFPYVILDEFPTPGQTASFLGKQYDPFYVGQNPNRPDFRIPELSLPESVTPERLNDRIGLLKLLDRQTRCLEQSATAGGLDAYRERAVGMLAAASVRKAFDLSREDIKLRDAYGRTAYGQSCLTARRLVEAGVRFVTVYFARYIDGKGDEGGWDTHGNNSQQLKDKLLPVTDQTVPTLLEDLKVRGLLDETLVVWMGEFGRTPRITNTPRFGPDGRDHWPGCYTVLLAGAGVCGGAVYGSSDRVAAFPTSNPVGPEDIAATLYWALGIDPHTEIQDPFGRPAPIAKGEPLKALFA